MTRRVLLMLALTMQLLALASSRESPLELLLPRPAQVSVRTGEADAAALARVTEVVADVGAPAGKPAEESYRLEISSDGVRLTAPTVKGLRYGRVTLRQLQALSAPGPVPACEIVDWPALEWRGLLLDCGRNYADLALIRETIDLLARYKLNVFHWHLTDHHGWRLESKRFPELQSTVAFERQVGRYYTQAEFREIVAYAAERGVMIVPEIDVPGHSGAFRRAFGFKSMRDPGVNEKVCALIDELCGLEPPERMPIIHLGTDEARKPEEKADDASYALWARQVSANGRMVMGWWPGHRLETNGPVVQETWYETVAPTGPYVDATCYYIDSFDPAGLLAQAAFKRPCSYAGTGAFRLGGEIQAWHDDPIETSGDLARDNPLFPAIVQFSDSYWRDLPTNRTDLIYCPPSPGKDGFDRLVDLECRVLAQRDRVLTDLTRPFHFVAQTHMRWRIEDMQGRVLREQIPSGVVYVRCPRANWGYSGFTDMVTGTVQLVSTFLSPTDRKASAIIETSAFHRSGARAYGLPAQGAWNRYGATIELNGEKILPPQWNHTGLSKEALAKTPWTDESAWIRPPTPIHIRKGKNQVRIILPKTDNVWYWGAAFIPIEGTRERPRELSDLTFLP
ncbi:MAG: beta-N-acetylhexosaminidase [Kiritimatiellae bacterium]|nr:beta-N-acetylhexosaminidase [Kiritimatiellia bacterium]